MGILDHQENDSSCLWLQQCFDKIGLGDVDELLSCCTSLFMVLSIVKAICGLSKYKKLTQFVAGSMTLNSLEPQGDGSRPPELLPYCCLQETWVGCSNMTLPCVYWDHYLAEFPVGQDYSTAVTSRVNITVEDAVNSETPSTPCQIDSFFRNCSFEEVGTHSAFYVANIEDFTIRIRHAVRGQIVHRKGSNVGDRAMRGQLVNMKSGSVVRKWPDDNPPYPIDQSDTRGGDIVSVKELLSASNTDIDQIADTGDPIRYDGLNVIIYVNYEMEGANNLRYTYQPRTLNSAEFKVEEVFLFENSTRRKIFNRHGVRLIFVQTGELGRFDFLELMTTIVTGLALVAIARTITNFIMLHVLKFKTLYSAHKYEVTEDFSVWRGMDKDERKKRMKIAREVGRKGIHAEGVEMNEPAFLQDFSTHIKESEA
eukprot:gene3065-5842_t